MRINRAILTALIVVLSLAAAPFAVASSSPGQHQGKRVGLQALCASHGSGLCMSDDGNPIPFGYTSQNFNGGVNQGMETRTNTGACSGGIVQRSPGCPFTQGSGNNTVFAGKKIVTIENVTHLTCGAINTAGNMVQLNCNQTGTDYVVDGEHYVNVFFTNISNNVIQYVQSQGLDQLILVQNASPSNWAFHS